MTFYGRLNYKLILVAFIKAYLKYNRVSFEIANSVSHEYVKNKPCNMAVMAAQREGEVCISPQLQEDWRPWLLSKVEVQGALYP